MFSTHWYVHHYQTKVPKTARSSLNSHISKQAEKHDAQIYWWPSIGGINGAKQKFVETNWRLYDNNACIKHWFRRNAIKQYNKTGGLECNNRLLNCCADVDVSTICDGETDPFDHPVLDHKERSVTPPDFRKDRQLALFQVGS